MSAQLPQLLEAIAASAKYRHVSAEFVQRLGEQELAKRRNLREAIQAVKNKLHQVGGAYLDQPPPYAAWLAELRATPPDRLRPLCARWLGAHASTRERLPILDEFYATLFAALPPIHSVADLACGLNPLARPWMPLPPAASYFACDIYADMTDFLDVFLEGWPGGGRAEAHDLLGFTPPRAQLALLLKTLPCLEQVDKAASLKLLQSVPADYLIVSFPAHSLGKRDKGMVENYAAHFQELVGDQPWPIKRFEFKSELAFVVDKTGGA